MEKKTFDIEYTETYANTYTVEAESFEEATEKLLEDIMNGRERGPEDCVNSDFKDVTEEEIKLVSLTDEELDLVSDCILSMLNRTDEAIKLLYDHAAVKALEDSRLKYRNLLTVFTSVMDEYR